MRTGQVPLRSIRGQATDDRDLMRFGRGGLLSGSLVEPLALTDLDDALRCVRQAATHLKTRSGITANWANCQWRMSKTGREGLVPLLDPARDHGQIQALLDSIIEHYGWRRLMVPETYEIVADRWRSDHGPPPGWPASANRGEVISVAVTQRNRWCWTEKA